MSEMRMFVAVKPDVSVVKSVCNFVEGIKGSIYGVKWVCSHNLHITLKFLGNVDSARTSSIKERLSTVSSEFEPFEISFQNLMAFPHPENPRVICVGIAGEGKRQLIGLATKCDDETVKAGLERSDKLFAAHLTLGRVKGELDLGSAARLKDVMGQKVELGRTVIDEIYLIESILTPSGPIYRDISRFELCGSKA